MSVKVSIVVPVYNGEKYIENCVGNLLKQTYDNLEFILVDDGSTDDSPRLCDEYAGRDSRFVVIHQTNQGLSAARNAGTMRATGEYILYYDVDDDITENLVSDNVRLALENDADVVLFNFWYHNLDTGERRENAYHGDFVGSGSEFFGKALCNTVDSELFNAPWNKLYSLKFLRDNGLEFLPEYPIYEDIILASRMFKCADRIVVNSDRYYVYYVRKTGSLISKYVDGYFSSVTKFYDCAMDYCRQFTDNARQIEKLSGLYVKLVTTNLKQISNNDALGEDTKIKLIDEICGNDRFRSALTLARLDFKKKIVRALVFPRRARTIRLMYKVLKNR